MAAILAACSGAGPRVAGPKKLGRSGSYERIEVPKRIAEDDRVRFEQRLFLLPSDHPDRVRLRDVLAASYAGSFEATGEKDLDGRMELFAHAMRLHAPGDFKPGRVADVLYDMALWTAERMESRGDESKVLAALAYARLVRPEDEALEERYREISEWSQSVRETIEDPLERYMSVCGLYMKIVRLVPSDEIVDELAGFLVQRQVAMIERMNVLERHGGGIPGFLYQMVMQREGIGKDMVYIYFLAGNVLEASEKLDGEWTELGMASEYIALLEDLEEGDDLGGGYFTLAGALGSTDPMAGLRACAMARERDPKDPRYSICVGNAFMAIDRPESALDFFVEASRVSPDEDVYAAVMDLTQMALFELHKAEKTDLMKDGITMAEGIIDKAMEMEDLDPELVPTSAAALLHTAGVIGFDNGWIKQAEEQLEKAYEIWPSMIGSLDKLVEIKQSAGRHREALAMLDKVLGEPEDKLQSFWRATLLEKRGVSLKALGDGKRAEKDFRDALERWKSTDIPPEIAPVAALRSGVILHRLGDMEGSNESFRKSIRLDPERRATYANVLSFLVTQGRLEDSKEFYRLAYNQDRIDEMWKIYFSLWVEGLSMRSSGESFDLARGYLEQSNGTSWQDDLARFFSKRVSFDELKKKAGNQGQSVESDFYGALVLLSEGKKEKAGVLLKRVVDSNLMGFFEYPMAKALLGASSPK